MRRLRSEAKDYVRDHPGYVAEVGFWNSLRMLNLEGPGIERLLGRAFGIEPALSTTAVAGFYATILLALAGMHGRSAAGAPVRVLIPVLLAMSVLFVVGGSTRYRLPADPFVIALASLGLVALWRRLFGKRGAPPNFKAVSPELDGTSGPGTCGRVSAQFLRSGLG